MPNWTTTMIKAKGLDKLKNKNGERVFAEGDSELPVVDFERLLPMPKSLRKVSSPADDAAVFCYLTDGFKNITDDAVLQTIDICHKPWPMYTPDKYKEMFLEYAEKKDPDEEVELSFGSENPEKATLYEKGKLYVDNTRLYGSPTWYDWACEVWGTKWNVSWDSSWWGTSDTDTIWMDTAWCPPGGFIEALAKEFPDLEAYIMFADEDFGSGCGVALIKDGYCKSKMLEYDSPDALRTAIHMIGGVIDPDEIQEEIDSVEETIGDEDSEASEDEISYMKSQKAFLKRYKEAMDRPITHVERFVSKQFEDESPN